MSDQRANPFVGGTPVTLSTGVVVDSCDPLWINECLARSLHMQTMQRLDRVSRGAYLNDVERAEGEESARRLAKDYVADWERRKAELAKLEPAEAPPLRLITRPPGPHMATTSKLPKAPDCTALLNAMAPHQGRARGISAVDLAEQLGLTRRILRKRISEARCQGVLLCGHPRTGYFMAETAEELRMATAFLEHRALHSLMLLSRMRGVGMPELLGQLRLNQA